jgi:hypothetical protein
MTMTNLKETRPARELGPAGDERPSAASTVQAQPTHLSSDAIDGAGLLRILEGDPHLLAESEVTEATPRVKRMPEGIEVRERQVGLAAGQWVLRVRCQCGRSWFEVEEVHWATCPRCSLLVRVNIDARQG